MLMVSTGLLLVAVMLLLSQNRTHPPLSRDSRDLMGALATRRLIRRLSTPGMLFPLLLITGSESFFSTSDPLEGGWVAFAVSRPRL